MAYSAKLKKEQLTTVKKELIDVLPDLLVNQFKVLPSSLTAEQISNSKIELGENLALYRLEYKDIKEKKPIHEAAIDTGNFMHLLFLDEMPSYYAISGPDNNSQWALQSVMSSNLAERLDEGINWVDRNWRKKKEVVILHVPAFHLYFLWLKDGKESLFLTIQWQDDNNQVPEKREFTEPELRKSFSGLGQPRGRGNS